MSLLVHVFVRDEEGVARILELPPDASDLAGFEAWRHQVWGSAVAIGLGAQFLPRLNGDDCWVEAEEVSGFLDECALLRRNLEALVPAGGDPVLRDQLRDGVRARLDNIEGAARRALTCGGGVLVW